MPSLGNISAGDFVPNFGDQLGHLVPDGPENLTEWAVAAFAVLGFWSSLVIAAIGAIGVGAELANATVPFGLDAVFTTTVGVPGIGDVLVVPYLAMTGLLATAIMAVGVSSGRFSDPSEFIEDDAVPTLFYYSLGVAFIQIRGPGLVAFAEAAVWTLIVFGVITWVVSAATSRMRG